MSYGGINGLNQAIDLATEALGNLKFVHEKKLIGKFCAACCFIYQSFVKKQTAQIPGIVYFVAHLQTKHHCFFVFSSKKLILLFAGKYFDEISQNTSKFCFGVDDTFRALEMGAVESLIVWENLDINRYVLRNHTTNSKSQVQVTWGLFTLSQSVADQRTIKKIKE